MTNEPEHTEAPNFEAALEGLEEIVGRLEDGSLGLDESLSEFEQGMKLLKQCHGLLEQAEQKIEVLTSVTADGQERTQPFGDSETGNAGNSPEQAPPPGIDAKSLF